MNAKLLCLSILLLCVSVGWTSHTAGAATLDSSVVVPGANLARTASRAVACSNPYVVRRGDTLSAIAGRCGTSVDNLRRWNGLYWGTVYTGQTLKTRGTIVPARPPSRAALPPSAFATPAPARPAARAVPTPRIEPTIAP